ncbi:hypothetical protein QQX98_008171 [Neonectria punicea]|uniref:Peptidase A1 domain-containing protein n=1 Tax=Neonectria punicea TaxID=979145 RepID=A0ABR1GVY7_9HYPO
MLPAIRLLFAVASTSYLATAATLDLPIIVNNGYKVVEFDIGTPAKTYRLLFDTGSASSWAVDGTCTTSCPNVSGYDRTGYNINASTTGHYTGAYADIPYLGGRTAGPTVSEVSILAVNGTRTVNGTVVDIETDFDIGNVVFDTGAGSITLPDEENLKVYESIGMNYTAILEGDHIPLCTEFNSSWSFSFSFGDYRDPQVVTLRGDQLRRPGFAYRDDACWPPFEGGGTPRFTLIGTPFLKNFYTVWDYGSEATETDVSQFEPKLSFGKLKSTK